MRTSRSRGAAIALRLALAAPIVLAAGCSSQDGPAQGTSLQRGVAGPTAELSQPHLGGIVVTFVDALTNVDTEPITVVSVRPARVDPGLTFVETVVDTTGGSTLVSWAGSAQEYADLARVHQYAPAKGVTIAPGQTTARLQMRYTLTDASHYPYRSDDVRVEYSKSGETFVETLRQTVVVDETPPPPPPTM